MSFAFQGLMVKRRRLSAHCWHLLRPAGWTKGLPVFAGKNHDLMICCKTKQIKRMRIKKIQKIMLAQGPNAALTAEGKLV